MNDTNHFEDIVEKFTNAVESNDGEALAALFTEDGVYSDGFYGEFAGRKAIATMLRDHFWGHAEGFHWAMSNLLSNGEQGYAKYLFSYDSTLPDALGKHVVFDGIAHFLFKEGLIERYEEIFNTGMAQAQLDFDPIRIKKHLLKRAEQLKSGET
ncbi:MAG: nuclear transport factor 2 family protein [Gammaproteobacteria bacterium]|nr:nuclear transport factor 2 family protein [Gammaproteobacteria bacterium]